MAFGLITGLIGIGASIFSTQQQAKAAKKTAKAQRQAAEEQRAAAQREKQTLLIEQERERAAAEEQRILTLGAQRARFASAGVNVSSGSASILEAFTEQRFDDEAEDREILFDLSIDGIDAQIAGADRARRNAKANTGAIIAGGLFDAAGIGLQLAEARGVTAGGLFSSFGSSGGPSAGERALVSRSRV